jgi:hypothetical protein
MTMPLKQMVRHSPNAQLTNVAALADVSTNVVHWTADLSLCAMAAIRSTTPG